MKPIYSVIVPIYNVEIYLKQCIDSILMQNFKEYEIILVVDETSQDKCAEIAKSYSRQYENVYTYMRAHLGLGDARNYGMQLATGEYLIFVDSDDYWEDVNFMEELSQSLQTNPDVSVFHYKKLFQENGNPIKVGKPWDNSVNSKSIKEKMEYLLTSENFTISAWTKVVKRDFAIENNLYFIDGYCEDFDWSMRLFAKIKKLEISNNDGYIHRLRQDSLSHNGNPRQCRDLYRIVYEQGMEYRKNEGSLPYNESILSYICYEYFILLGLYHLVFPQKEDKKLWNQIKELKWLMHYGCNRKTKLSRFVCRIFGLNMGSRILAAYISSK